MRARLLRCALILAGGALLAGCLEVEQHPPWRDGRYDGKTDNLPSQLRFGGDHLAWNAALENRNRQQNEYVRTHH